jgi:hypothetical protein
MRVAIMQPTYLPWCGYFDLIDQADFFVFLDDVAFQKRSWQQRNRIVRSEGLSWLTLPVKSKGMRGQRICDVEISDLGVLAKHRKALATVYSGAPFLEALLWEYELVAESAGTSLSMLNVGLIEAMCKALGIGTRWALASELGVGAHRGEHLARLCQAVGATEYLTPPGSVDYLQEDIASFENRGISVRVQEYEHPTYEQGGRESFCSHASAIDLLARTGPKAGAILRSGRRESTFLQDNYSTLKPVKAIA